MLRTLKGWGKKGVIALSHGVFASNYSGAIPPTPTTIYETTGLSTNLVSAYPLRDNTLDYHNIYDGTNNGATQTGSGAGFFDRYYDFDGVNDFITAPALTGITNQISISIWVYHNSSSLKTFFSLRQLGSPYKIASLAYKDTDNKIVFQFYNTTAGSVVLFSTTVLSTNTWYHITGTYNGTTAKLYINNVEEDSDSFSGNLNIDSNVTTNFGRNTNIASSQHWLGRLTQPLIFNTALTSTQVSQLYNSGSGLFLGTPATLQQHGSLTTNMVSYWKFDENTGTIANDSHGANNGTITGATWTTGKINGGLDFDGTNDNVVVPDHASLKLSSAWTAFGFVKLDTLVDCGIIGKFWDGSKRNWDFRIRSTGSFGCELGNASGGFQGSFYSSTGLLTTGVWYHLIATYATNTLQLYLNGVLVYTSAGRTNPSTNNDTVNIGSYYTGAAGWLNGVMDEMGISGKGLTAGEALVLAQGIPYN